MAAITYHSQGVSPSTIHATFKSPAASSGNFHAFGFYEAPAADANLTQLSATQTLGSANNAYMAQVFIVAAAAGTVGGTGSGVAKITITGTSVTHAGVRTPADSEVLVADITALTTNQFVESTKMWVGTVTLTLAPTVDRSEYAVDFNYGYASVSHFFEHTVQIKQFECTGRAGATDTGFNIQLLKHSSVGWVYHATAFVPGGTVILDMNTDLNTEKNITSGKRFHYHRKNLTNIIIGSDGSEGVVLRIITGANNAVESMDMRIHFNWM
jgi:hypothetical protein